MGKKNKKVKVAEDVQSIANECEQENSDKNVIPKKRKKKYIHSSFSNNSTTINNVDLEANLEKKHRKRDLNNVATDSAPVLTNEIIENSTSEVKKKKRKIASDQEVKDKVENDEINVINKSNNAPSKKKKKKKDHSLLVEKNNQDTNIELIGEAEKIKKKKRNKDSSNEKSEETISNNDDNVIEKAKKKSKKKKKSKNDVLNEDEAQVTEEDIDRFCEGLDEEDNQQFEDWVQLLEASLPPRRIAK